MLISWKKFIILLFFIFGLAMPFFSRAADCKIINVLTSKTMVGLNDSLQVNITARPECIGQTAVINICDTIECAQIPSETFNSRKVNGQNAINPIVLTITPTDLLPKNTTAWVQATVPAITIKSRQFTIDIGQGNTLPVDTSLPGNVNGTGNPSNPNPSDALSGFPGENLEANDVIKIIIGLSCWLTRVAFTLAIIFLFLAGLRFVVAQGNQTKFGEAVKNFQHVLVGILVIYGVYVIIATVASAVGVTNFSFIPLVC